jgi:hypothetical protein
MFLPGLETRLMKRTLAAAMMFALALTPLTAGAGTMGAISGTMRGPAGPMAGVRVNVLNTTGAIVGSATTNGSGVYALEGLPAGTYVLQAISANGSVLTTPVTTLDAAKMTATGNLAASAAAAPAAQSAAVTGSAMDAATVWWIVGASAATAGVISAIALQDDPSPTQ